MSEYKPNTGKAWIMKPEAKQKRIDKYMTDPKYSWFVSLSDEEKQKRFRYTPAPSMASPSRRVRTARSKSVKRLVSRVSLS